MSELGPCPLCGSACDADFADAWVWCTKAGCVYEMRFRFDPETHDTCLGFETVAREVLLAAHEQMSEAAELVRLLDWASSTECLIDPDGAAVIEATEITEQTYRIIASAPTLIEALREAKTRLEANNVTRP